jgi:hypothetical protein
MTKEREEEIRRVHEASWPKGSLSLHDYTEWMDIHDLLRELDATRADRETWGNEFAAVCMAKSERTAWINYAAELREALMGCFHADWELAKRALDLAPPGGAQ